MATNTKRIAIIGAGPCGLGATKSCKEEGLEPVCFERSSNYGGLWRYHENDDEGTGSVMKTTIINTSKELGAASDHPPPKEYPNYMHHTLMYEYIGMLAKKFDVLRHVHYNQEVIKIEPSDDYEFSGRWIVTRKDTIKSEIKSEEFDGVMVCVGHHIFPRKPTFPGQEKYQGKIMHTHSLKKVDEFADQNVVVVGVGNSGMDAAVEITTVAKQVYLSSRRGTWVLPRVGPKGHPFDAVFTRRYINLMQRYLPYNWVCYFYEKRLNGRFNHEAYNIKPKHRALSQHPTVSDTLPIKLLSGTVAIRGKITKVTKTGVIFENEQTETPADSIILATGYQIKFPFFSDKILRVKDNRIELYKFIYPPDLPHATLAILGLIQPSGAGFPVGEMQCRWSAHVMSGKCKLPSKDEMYKDIRAKDEANRRKFVDSPRHTVQVDFIAYQDELGSLIGAKPNLLKLMLTDPKLFWAIFTGPSLPYQYRLQGPNAWDGARKAILTYQERVHAPLQKPGQPPYKSKRRGLAQRLTIRLMFLLPFIWWFFLGVVMTSYN